MPRLYPFSTMPSSSDRGRSVRSGRHPREGASIFYLGPNNTLASILAHASAAPASTHASAAHGEDPPLALCYFWSAALLNKAPFHNFALGLVSATHWSELLAEANDKVRAMLAKTPVYLLTRHTDDKLAEAPFPVHIVGHFDGDGPWAPVLAAMLAQANQAERDRLASGPLGGKVIPLERERTGGEPYAMAGREASDEASSSSF